MFVKEILNVNKEAHEADIIVSDGNFNILCYSCDYEDEKIKDFELTPMDYDEVYLTYEREYKISKFDQSRYNYEIQCEILNVERAIVRVFGILISLARYLPGDIKNGDWITFKCYRLGIDLVY